MKRALVIGATSGIGTAIAVALSRRSWQLVLHGRNEDRLRRVCSQCQPPSPESAPSRHSESLPTGLSPVWLTGDVVAWAENPASIPEIPPVDLVVWSAGICELAAGHLIGLKALRRTLSVNLEAPLVVTSYFYRKRIIQDSGTVVLMGSEAAHEAGEGFSVYAASKGGLAAAARVLQKEFNRRAIRLICLEPGTVDTPMTRKLVSLFPSAQADRAKTDSPSPPKLGDPGFPMMSPEDLAREVLDRV